MLVDLSGGGYQANPSNSSNGTFTQPVSLSTSELESLPCTGNIRLPWTETVPLCTLLYLAVMGYPGNEGTAMRTTLEEINSPDFPSIVYYKCETEKLYNLIPYLEPKTHEEAEQEVVTLLKSGASGGYIVERGHIAGICNALGLSLIYNLPHHYRLIKLSCPRQIVQFPKPSWIGVRDQFVRQDQYEILLSFAYSDPQYVSELVEMYFSQSSFSSWSIKKLFSSIDEIHLADFSLKLALQATKLPTLGHGHEKAVRPLEFQQLFEDIFWIFASKKHIDPRIDEGNISSSFAKF